MSDLQHPRGECVEQQRCNDVALVEALFDGKPHRKLAVTLAHASLHVIVELADGRELGGRDATSLQNIPQDGAVYGVIRFFCEVDEAHVKRDTVLLAEFLYSQSANDEHHVDGRASRPEAKLIVRENPSRLTAVTQAAGDGFEKHLTSVRHERKRTLGSHCIPCFSSSCGALW